MRFEIENPKIFFQAKDLLTYNVCGFFYCLPLKVYYCRITINSHPKRWLPAILHFVFEFQAELMHTNMSIRMNYCYCYYFNRCVHA